MTMRDTINIQYPVLDHSESVANITIETMKVKPENGITIKDAFYCTKSPFIVINNQSDIVALLTVKAGDAYPNSMLGDIVIELAPGISAIRIQDLSRFSKNDYSLDLDFSEGFNGTIYCVDKFGREDK